MKKRQARTSIGEALVFRVASIYSPLLEKVVRRHTRKQMDKVQMNGQSVSSLVKACSERLRDRGRKEKYSYTRRHSFEVGLFSYIIASEARKQNQNGVNPRVCFAGGFVHDVGKTFLPKALLIKELGVNFGLFCLFKTKMTDKERKVLRHEHVTAGPEFVRFFGDTKDIQTVLNMASQHHITYNGFDSTHPSYPRLIEGSELPFHARIAKTADFLSAIMPRHYRTDSWVHTFDDAIAYAIVVAGKELDPFTVKCFISGTHDISFLEADMLVENLRHLGPQNDISDYKKIEHYVKTIIQTNSNYWDIMQRRSRKKMNGWINEICRLAKEFGTHGIEELARAIEI
jgi:HD-GYP domain-containing protein (c-di-GMP phosphodiesterase class II)